MSLSTLAKRLEVQLYVVRGLVVGALFAFGFSLISLFSVSGIAIDSVGIKTAFINLIGPICIATSLLVMVILALGTNRTQYLRALIYGYSVGFAVQIPIILIFFKFSISGGIGI